jgi:hypothetical protein
MSWGTFGLRWLHARETMHRARVLWERANGVAIDSHGDIYVGKGQTLRKLIRAARGVGV